MTEKTIFIAVYRAFSVRYILESGIFAELRKRPIRIVILHPDHESDYMKERSSGENVVLEPFPYEEGLHFAKGNRLSSFFKQVRYCTYGGQRESDYGTRRIFQETHFGSEKKARLALSAFSRACRASKLARRLLLGVESRLFASREAEPLFRKYKPSMLITSSVGYALDNPIMRLARKHGCKVLSMVHSWDNPSTKGYRGATPDAVVAWNDIMKDELVRYHDIDPDRVFVGGVAHWDTYFHDEDRCRHDEFLRRHGIPEGRKTIFYAPTGFKHIPTTLDEVEFLLQCVREDAFGAPCHLLVRMHPGYIARETGRWADKIKNDLDRVERLSGEYSDCSTFNFPQVQHLEKQDIYPVEDLYLYADILRHSDVMVTEYSTCIIEGCIFDLPVINVGYQEWRDTGRRTSETMAHFNHLRRIFGLNAVRHANSREQLFSLIGEYLANKDLDSDARRRLVEQECPVNQGRAGQAIAKYIYSKA